MEDDWRPDISFRLKDRDNEQTELVLDYFRRINRGESISFGAGIGNLKEDVVVAGIEQGIKTRRIKWRWWDSDDMPSDNPVVNVVKEDKSFVNVSLSDLWLEKVSAEVPKVRVPRFTVLGIKLGNKEIGFEDTRTQGRIDRDDKMVTQLVKDIYTAYRELQD